MGRDRRAAYAPAFGEGGDFNEQLYDALQAEPVVDDLDRRPRAPVSCRRCSRRTPARAPKADVVQRDSRRAAPEREARGGAARGARGDTERSTRGPRARRSRSSRTRRSPTTTRPTTTCPTRSRSAQGGSPTRPSRAREQRPHRHRRRRGRRVQGPRRRQQPALATGGGGKRGRPTTRSSTRSAGSPRTSPPDGGWEGAGFDRWCDGKPAAGARPDGPGKAQYDVGRHGPRAPAPSSAPATRTAASHRSPRSSATGLRYLKNVQDPEGCFGPRATQHYIYNHAIAALAMVEAYGMTESPIYKGSAQKALDFIALVAQPVLRVALRREARRQRHLGHGLDDDGAQEREAHQRGAT